MASPTLQTIPEDILVEIFLDLTTPVSLACSAATCTSFLYLIKIRYVCHCFCSLNRPPLIGFMDPAGFHPVEAPRPSRPLVGSITPCVDNLSYIPPVFTLYSYFFLASQLASYIPIRCMPRDEEILRWRPREARDGRVLLYWVSFHLRVV